MKFSWLIKDVGCVCGCIDYGGGVCDQVCPTHNCAVLLQYHEQANQETHILRTDFVYKA